MCTIEDLVAIEDPNSILKTLKEHKDTFTDYTGLARALLERDFETFNKIVFHERFKGSLVEIQSLSGLDNLTRNNRIDIFLRLKKRNIPLDTLVRRYTYEFKKSMPQAFSLINPETFVQLYRERVVKSEHIPKYAEYVSKSDITGFLDALEEIEPVEDRKELLNL